MRLIRNWLGGTAAARCLFMGALVVLSTMGGWWALAGTAEAAGATNITLTLSPNPVKAGSTTTATAHVTDAGGNGVTGETVTYSSTLGDGAGPMHDSGGGNYTATITTSTTPGQATITATDTTATPSQLSKSATLTQQGPATSVTVMLSANQVKAGSTTTATATVTDAAGDPLSGESVAFTGTLGDTQTGPTHDNLNGTYTATITTSTSPGTAKITATDTTPTTPVTSPSANLIQYGKATSVVVSLAPASIPANGVSTSVATATVTDAGGDLVPGDTVVFTTTDPGDHVSTTTDNGDGTYTAIITSSTKAGTPAVIASDQTAGVTGMATLTQTAGAPAGLTMQLSPASIVANGVSTSTAVASVADANGNPVGTDTVVFSSSDPNEKVGPTTNNGNGTYSAVITSSTSVAAATITATDLTTGKTAHATLTQTATGSSTTLVASPSSPVTNQGVTLTATVTSSPVGPSGAITFENGGVPISGCVSKPISPSNPTATCQTSFPASNSPENLTAVFTPSVVSPVGGSTGLDILKVGKGSTSTALAVSSSAVKVGTSVTYTATVSPALTGPAQPSGSVDFGDGGTPISSCMNEPLHQQNGALVATCSVNYSNTGAHTITALYVGDANFLGSISQAQSVTVKAAAILGRIGSDMKWTFFYTPTYTTVLSLRIEGAPIGSTVLVTCTGTGCPFLKRTDFIAKPKPCRTKGKHKCPVETPGTVRLQAEFGNHHLHVGTQITVEVVQTGWIGKYYSFTVRSGKGPSVSVKCLAPGQSRPGIGC